MKNRKILILIIVLGTIASLYFFSFNKFGNNEKVEVNNPTKLVSSEKNRLEDDFYEYINYDYLNTDKLDDKLSVYYSFLEEEIEEEKKKIINELLNENSNISNKMKIIKSLYKQRNKEESLAELNKYIDKINNSSNIKEFYNNVININYELSTDILVSSNVLFNYKGDSKKSFGFDLLTYDWDNSIGYYSMDGYKTEINMYKKYNIQLLKECGYTSNEAVKMVDNIQKMYKEISKFSELDGNKLLEKGYKIYSVNELQNKLNNININEIIKYYSKFYNEKDGILVADINQLLLMDEYLKEENLETLKQYATLKILTKYSKYISDETYNIYFKYYNEANKNGISKDLADESEKEEIEYAQIYTFFKDTIIEEFAKKHFSKEQREFYINLIKKEIAVYKERIIKAEWLSNDTKEKAIKKMDEITFVVGIEDKLVKIEKTYNIKSSSSYISNVVNIEKKIKEEQMQQIKKGNIFYYYDEVDALEINAYYSPYTNSINVLLGYIYSLTKTLNLGTENLENNYYKILGGIGTTIGHELSHALDTDGSKFDEKGNYINWWNEEDKFNFTKLTSRVIKYYENFKQFGNTTVNENIADLGGMSIVLEIAKQRNATIENYKEIFQNYALIFSSQTTSIYREYLLKEDIHSPNKNRVNAVLSSFDIFYEVYNIKQTDKMYVLKENRVSVW